MTIRRVTTEFTGYDGTPYYNNLYFTEVGATDVQDTIDNVESFWDEMLYYSASTILAKIQGDVAQIDEETGETTGYLYGTSGTAVGEGSVPYHPPSVQLLLRLRTGAVVGGRRLLGHVFVPALSTAVGNEAPSAPISATFETAANALASGTTSSGPWLVWSKKHGATAAVTSTSVWEKYAVLRSRRD
uniref:Uncharacterized protein n=1 Tax=uncultured prokaryote TaxID=198431 RepID=A0A0H5Q7S1_9ZZZZ|nr:hypothetical protein [uncultured prokaryote]